LISFILIAVVPVTLHRANFKYQGTIFAPAGSRTTVVQNHFTDKFFSLMLTKNTWEGAAQTIKWLVTGWEVRVQFIAGTDLVSIAV
jgi:hypothetical protein